MLSLLDLKTKEAELKTKCKKYLLIPPGPNSNYDRAHKDYLSPEQVREIGRELIRVKTMIAQWRKIEGQAYRIM